MTRFLTMRRLGILFVGLFAVAIAGMFTYQHFVLDPRDKCEESGRWWFAEEDRCVTPLYIPDITKRPAGVSRAEASAAGNREFVEYDHRIASEDAARRAQTDRDRALVEKNSGL